MVALKVVRDDEFFATLRNRQSDADRIAKYGWNPHVSCSWCGDTGISPETGVECFCSTGTVLAAQKERTTHWPSLVPFRFREYRLAEHPNRKLADEVGAWIDSKTFRSGENLVIQGGVGVGKTGAAIAALRELHFQGASVRYWSMPDLMDTLRAEEFERNSPNAVVDGQRKKPTMSQLIDCDFLLLDDIGTERITDYVRDRVYVIVDGRWREGRSIILTTNLKPDALWKHLGDRIASRIRESVSYVAAVGPDLRGRK